MDIKKYILLSAIIYSPIVSSTPSFTCGSNLNPVEQKICTEDELSKINNTMVRIYKSIFQTKYITEASKEKIKEGSYWNPRSLTYKQSQ